MFSTTFLGSPSGLEISRLNMLERLDRRRYPLPADQHILDDAGDVEKSDSLRQESRDRCLVGGIQHDRCKSARHQSLTCQA